MSRPRYSYVGASVLSALMLGLGACSPGPSDSPQAPVGYVAVVGAARSDPLWPVLRATAARYGRTVRRFEIRVVAPEARSAALQSEVVTNLPREDLVGLCVQVFDPRASRRVLESARSQGLVVVTMARRVDAANPFLHSGIDQREMGAALADALAELVPGGGTVATLLDGSDPALQIRQRGFAARIARHPNLTVLREFDCGGDPASALRLMREATERFPGLDGWASMGGWPLLERSEGTLLPPGCMLVVPGLVPDLVEHIRAGRCHAAVLADYDDMVTRALEMCVVALEGRVPAVWDHSAPLSRISRSNLPEFEAQWARWTGEAEPDNTQP